MKNIVNNLPISVIVLTYRPCRKKLIRTLRSVFCQKGIPFEVILADDGSPNEDWSWLEPFFQQNGITEYATLIHEHNQGTVRNLLDGVELARGKYIYAISPGDFFFDEHVLTDLYHFAEKTQSSICFGNAVYYSNQDGAVKITKQYGKPICPQNYALNVPKEQRMLAFFGLDWINGATFFRERTVAREYLTIASHYCRYMEDNSSTAFALGDGIPVVYYERNVIWYEDGTGVSTSATSKWKKVLDDEAESFAQSLHQDHPRDKYMLSLLIMLQERNRISRIAKRLMYCPVVTMKTILQKKRVKPQQIVCSEEDLAYLESLLEEELCK